MTRVGNIVTTGVLHLGILTLDNQIKNNKTLDSWTPDILGQDILVQYRNRIYLCDIGSDILAQ